jgi:hypothetical protein
MLRILLPESGQHKGSRSCDAASCTKNTREGKPYCSAHIEQAPYIKVVLAELARRHEEEKILNQETGDVPKDGFFVREGLLLLRTRDFTAKAFSRRLDVSHHAANRLIEMLVRWGHAVQVRTSRGGSTVGRVGGPDLEDGL